MAERRFRTDEEMHARRELLKDLGVANEELAATIPDRCSGCEGAIIAVFALADRVARKAMTIEEAKASLANDTGECEGSVQQEGVYDGKPDCWRVIKLGEVARKRGYSAFSTFSD